MACAPLDTGGFDCEFVDPIPESLCCPVCLLPFHDPHLLDCCGAKYCAECIGRVKASGQACPICKQQFNTMLDKNEQRKVLNLRVRCSKKNEGCDWEGELRRLNDHERETCEWVSLECRYECGGRIPRRRLAAHEQDECPQRPMDVKMESFMRKMEQRHIAEIVAIREEMEEKDKVHTAEIAAVREEMEEKDIVHTAEMDELEHSLKERLAVQEEKMKEWVKGEIMVGSSTPQQTAHDHEPATAIKSGFRALRISKQRPKKKLAMIRGKHKSAPLSSDGVYATASDVLPEFDPDSPDHDLPTFGSVLTRRVPKRAPLHSHCLTPSCFNYAKELGLCQSCLEKN